jgi:pyridinium-3,5-bisthiocarboxylic acid mononucleotide nickel chelatase
MTPDSMMRQRASTLLFDPFAGISGDMTLGALIDIGLPAEWLRDFAHGLGLGDITVHVERANRRGIDCGRVRFDLPHEHAHRHLRHIVEIIDRSNAPERAKERARDAFSRIAVAEAAVHGTTVEKVHFHEVGALDAILDILCTMAGIEVLGFESFATRPAAVGSGWVDIAHGRFPVPAPATLRILEGVPVTGMQLDGECTTPTGAAILATLTEGRPAPAQLTPHRTGFGAGTRDPASHPNCLRLLACTTGIPSEPALVLIQADVDDLAPEYAAPAQDAILQAGARDVVFLPLAMKKGRPGLRLEALADEARLQEVVAAVFRATPTIGLRHWRVERPALERTTITVRWRGHAIRCKQVVLPDGTRRAKPEYEDVLQAAMAENMPAWQVRLEVEAAATNTDS